MRTRGAIGIVAECKGDGDDAERPRASDRTSAPTDGADAAKLTITEWSAAARRGLDRDPPRGILARAGCAAMQDPDLTTSERCPVLIPVRGCLHPRTQADCCQPHAIRCRGQRTNPSMTRKSGLAVTCTVLRGINTMSAAMPDRRDRLAPCHRTAPRSGAVARSVAVILVRSQPGQRLLTRGRVVQGQSSNAGGADVIYASEDVLAVPGGNRVRCSGAGRSYDWSASR